MRLRRRRGTADATGSESESLVSSSGSHRAAVTLVDQIFSSVSNFAVAVAVARVAGASGLGGFSLAYAGWLVLAGMHRALITDPMAIHGDAREPSSEGVKSGLGAEILLGLLAAVVFGAIGVVLTATGQHTFGPAMLALAPWLPALVVQDYWRWVGFMSRRPDRSLLNDSVFNVVQFSAFGLAFGLGLHSAAAMICCWGLGATAGALFGLRQFRVLPWLRGGWELLRLRWSFSKWLAGDSILNTGSNQAYVFIAGVILGPVGLGGLRAAQALVTGPSMMLIQAGGSVGLPEASKAYDEHGWAGLARVARIVTAVGFLSVVAVAVVVAVWGRTLLSRIYGPQFGHLEVAALIMAIGYVLAAFGLGPGLILKTTRNSRSLFGVQSVQLAATLGSLTFLSLRFGVDGAAEATIVTVAVNLLGVLWFKRRARRKQMAQEPSEVAATGEVSVVSAQ